MKNYFMNHFLPETNKFCAFISEFEEKYKRNIMFIDIESFVAESVNLTIDEITSVATYTFVVIHFNDFIDNCEDCVTPSTVLKTLKEYLMDKPSREVNGLFNSSLENITVAMAKTMGKLYC